MTQFREWIRKLGFVLRRNKLSRDLEEEMTDHLQRKIQKNIAAGMSTSDAQYAAQRQLGNSTLQQEQSRTSWGFPLLESLVQDIRYGVRGLRNAPGFTAVAVLTLALGIGATTAIFSISNTVLLRPLPYADSSRLVHVWGKATRFPEFNMGMSYPDAEQLGAHARSFDQVAWFQTKQLVLTGSGEPEQITAMAISPDFLRLFSIQPLLGSGFQPDDYELKNGRMVLLSYSLWQQRFASDRNIVGRMIAFDRLPYTVVGVLPKGFKYAHADAWVPLVVTATEKNKRENWMFMTLAKLKASVSIRSAQVEADNFQASLIQAFPKEESDSRIEIMSLREGAIDRDNRNQLLTLAGAVTFLLLIGCANVSNLILSRGVQRRREILLRTALGASRMRILRQLLTESLILSLAGGAAGIILGALGINAFRVYSPPTFSRLNEVQLEPGVALIALLISCVSGVLCGLAPALHVSRSDLNLALKEHSASTPRRRCSLRNFLVVSEISLALALLTGSALLAQSLARMLKVDTGFRTDHMLTAEIELGDSRYPSDDSRRRFIQRVLAALRAEPQFKAVAIANNSLLTDSTAMMAFDPELMGIHEKQTTLEAKSVSPGFFEAMNIPVLSGRSFNDRDVNGGPEVVIVSQSMAKRFFPGQDPVGTTFKTGPDLKEHFEIVGVVADTRDIQLTQKLQPQVYFPLLQDDPYNGMSVMVRSSSDPLTLVRLLQQRVWSVDKDQPLTQVNSMGEVIAKSIAEPRFHTWLVVAFAAAGLTLTLSGIYGVISYSVGQRTAELGIRVALGAQHSDVLRLILKEGIRMAVFGALIGTLGSLLLMRLLTSQLYGIKPTDPLTLVAAAMLMLVVALCASYIPARRASRIDPMSALRNE